MNTELNFTLPQNLVLNIKDHNVSFNIVFVPPSEETNNKWLVNIYDARYNVTEHGQFISSYYLSTFLTGSVKGITLEGSVLEWYLTEKGVKQVHHHVLFHSNPEFYKDLLDFRHYNKIN